MLKKYFVTIICDETKITMILKSKLTKQQLYNVLCKMYDDFDSCEIEETKISLFNFSYVVSNIFTNEKLKRYYC